MQQTSNKPCNKTCNKACTLPVYSIVIKTTAETKEYLTQAGSTKEALSKALDYLDSILGLKLSEVTIEVKQKAYDCFVY